MNLPDYMKCPCRCHTSEKSSEEMKLNGCDFCEFNHRDNSEIPNNLDWEKLCERLHFEEGMHGYILIKHFYESLLAQKYAEIDQVIEKEKELCWDCEPKEVLDSIQKKIKIILK